MMLTLKLTFKVIVGQIWLVHSIRSLHFPNTCTCKPCRYLASFGRCKPLKFRPNPMTLILTLKVTEFPDAVRQEDSPGPDEENKKKFIKIGRAVRELFNGLICVTCSLTA